MADYDQDAFDAALRNAVLSADQVAFDSYRVEADRTRAIVQRAMECLLENKMVTLRPVEDWPDWIQLGPPWDDPPWI